MSNVRNNQLAIFSVFFTRTEEAEYKAATQDGVWNEFCAAAPDIAQEIKAPLSYSTYRHFVNRVLTPGIPGALPPVESLYKDWGGHKAGLQYGQGFYLGESAKHVRALYESQGIEIPREYQAMPDHLVLLLEFNEYLREQHSALDAYDFVQHHFDWLADYRSALSSRSHTEADKTLVQALDFYQHLLSYIEQFVFSDTLCSRANSIIEDTTYEKGRSTEEVILHG